MTRRVQHLIFQHKIRRYLGAEQAARHFLKQWLISSTSHTCTATCQQLSITDQLATGGWVAGDISRICLVIVSISISTLHNIIYHALYSITILALDQSIWPFPKDSSRNFATLHLDNQIGDWAKESVVPDQWIKLSQGLFPWICFFFFRSWPKFLIIL